MAVVNIELSFLGEASQTSGQQVDIYGNGDDTRRSLNLSKTSQRANVGWPLREIVASQPV